MGVTSGELGRTVDGVGRQIHELSHRRVQRFVTVNCGGIPADLLESELFGHKKGAFTGALTGNSCRFRWPKRTMHKPYIALCAATRASSRTGITRPRGPLIARDAPQQDAVHRIGPRDATTRLQCHKSAHGHLPDRHHLPPVDERHDRPLRFAHRQMPRIAAGADVVCRHGTREETELGAAGAKDAPALFDDQARRSSGMASGQPDACVRRERVVCSCAVSPGFSHPPTRRPTRTPLAPYHYRHARPRQLTFPG
jgi:hypothetical protein